MHKHKFEISADESVLRSHSQRQDSFLNMVLGLIPCQVFIKDPLDGFKYKIANKNFIDYYKLNESDVLEHPDEDIFEPDVAKQLRRHDTEVCANPEKVFRFDEDVSFKRKGMEVFKSLKVCFKTADGHPYMLGICVDVTEFVRNSDRMQKTQDLLNLVINSLPVCIFAKNADDDFRYTIANNLFADFVGKTQEQIIGRTDAELFVRTSDSDAFAADDVNVMQNGKKLDIIEHPVDSKGVKHHIKTVKIPTTAPDGSRLLLGISMDITDISNMIKIERINNEALSGTFANADLKSVVEKISQILKTELDCSRVLFLALDKDKNLELFHEEYSAELQPLYSSDLSEYKSAWDKHLYLLKEGEITIHKSLSESPSLDGFLRRHPECASHSLAEVPMYVDGELLGCIMISFNVMHDFTDIEKALLRSMGKIVSLAAIRDRQSRYMRQAEEENQALLDNISIPLWLYDSNGVIMQTNKAADKLFGFPESKIPYSCKDSLKCGKDDLNCPVKKVLNSKRTDHEHCNFNGRNYLLESNPIADSKGDVRGVVSSFYDVSELEQAISSRQSVTDCLTNLAREDNMLQAMQKSIRGICEFLKASRCYIIRLNPERKSASCFIEYAKNGNNILEKVRDIPYSDPNMEEHFKEHPLFSLSDIFGIKERKNSKGLDDFLAKFNVKSAYAHRIMLGGKLWGYIGAMYENNPHNLSDVESDFIGSIAYCIELMLIRQNSQDKIMEALRKAESADKAKSMFLASMSHEIRTPLNAVIGFSELLKDGSLPKDTETKYLSAISNAGNALLALINDVLDLSKLEAGQMVFTTAPVDLSALVAEVGNIFLQKCNQRKLAFKAEVPADLGLVLIDKLRVRQILFNLVGNAVKFTESGSISVKIGLEKLNKERGTLRISVADTGIGISKEDQKRIFGMFVQASALRGTQIERNGTGLGLAICKRMIEKMNGEFFVESEIGKGSEFSVILHDVKILSRQEKSAQESIQLLEDSEPLKSKTVLVADDVTMNLSVMTAILEKLSQRVLTAKNADEALEVLSKNSVDILLTDLWMPGINGAELATKIRRSGKNEKLIIAVLTADTEVENNFDMSIFNAILTKPVTIEKVRRFLAAH